MRVKFNSNTAHIRSMMEKTIRSTLDTIGDKVVEWAQDLAPVDTGNLKSSLTHEAQSNDVEIVGTSNQKAPYKNVDYAPFVELGTVKMRAQPFLRPAIEQNQRTIREIVEASFKDSFK